MHEFNSFVCSGGAVRVISAIGVIKYLEEHNLLKNMKNYVGTSAGTIICLFLTLNYTSSEMVSFLLDNLYDDAINKFEIDEIFNLFSEYGLSKGNNIITFIQRIIYNKLKVNDITFIELAKQTGKNLVICVSNLTKTRVDFFNLDNTPQLSIVTAIRISTTLPFIFTPLLVNGDICIDGGAYNNFPIDYFKDNTLKNIFGINITNTHYQKVNSFMEYVFFLMNTMIEKANNKSINDLEKNIVTIDFEDDGWISFKDLKINFPKEKMKEYIKLGYDSIKSLNFK